MEPRRWMIYGANGYTGRLIAEEARRRGEAPVLAGRNGDAVRALARELGLEARAFPLDSAGDVVRETSDIGLVLNAAGPFSRTAAPLVAGALAGKSHYLDITGEIGVFEAVFARHREAEKSGSVLLPGVGFDVVPSDCLAAQLSARLPRATRLELAIGGTGGVSPGTLKTMVEALPYGGRTRRDGKIVVTPLASPRRWIRFSHRELHVAAIPWGDVSTAYRSTGIPDITVYAALPPTMARVVRILSPGAGLLAAKPLQRWLHRTIEKRVPGPSSDERQRGRSYLWGQAQDGAGGRIEATLETPESYRLTALSAVESVRRVLHREVPAGAWTPSRAFGADFVLALPETKLAWRE